MSDYFPPVSFYFELSIGGSEAEASFKEASGFNVEMEVEPIKEGGNNKFEHKLPGRAKYTNLVLKRGLLVKGSALHSWLEETLQGDQASKIKTKTLVVSLLEPKGGGTLMHWSFNRAFPVKWSISDFNSEESSIVIETIEFAYQDFKAKK